MNKIERLCLLAEVYEMSLWKRGQASFETADRNAAVIKDFLSSNEDKINEIINEKEKQ